LYQLGSCSYIYLILNCGTATYVYRRHNRTKISNHRIMTYRTAKVYKVKISNPYAGRDNVAICYNIPLPHIYKFRLVYSRVWMNNIWKYKISGFYLIINNVL